MKRQLQNVKAIANANENTNTLMVRLGGLRLDCWLRNDTAAGATATTFLSLRDPLNPINKHIWKFYRNIKGKD